MNDFKIITVSTGKPYQDYYTFNEFFKSVRGHRPIILDANFLFYSGLGSKPKMVYKAIKDNILDTKYFIFSDCWDLVFSCDPQELFDTYRRFKSPIVISSEKNCFPHDLKDEYDKLPSTSSFKYLNSGMIVGETEAMLALLESMDLKNVPDDYWDKDHMVHINDQFLYQQIFLKQPVEIKLDYDQHLCQTMHDVKLEELDFTTERIQNIETESFPCSFHLNGGSKTSGVREPILKHLKLL